MCCCNCDPCWACGTRPTQGIISGSVLSYSTPENGTYDVYAYCEQDTPQYYDGVHIQADNHGFNLSSVAGACSAFNVRGGPFFAQAYDSFSQLFNVYGWKIGTRTSTQFGVVTYYDLLLTDFTLFYFVGGEWAGNNLSGSNIYPTQGVVDRFAGGRNNLGISSRRAMAAVVFNYRELRYYGTTPYYSDGRLHARKEIFQATLSSPCRDVTGTVTLSAAANATWTGAPTTGGFYGNWGLDTTTTFKSVQLVF